MLESVILGVIEGFTEFLPVSSTGHLVLASKILNVGQSDFLKSFEIIIQLGAILSVMVLYWKSFWNFENIKKLVVAFVPTGIIGLAFYKIVKIYFIGNLQMVLWSLFIGGVILIIFEWRHKEAEGTGGTGGGLTHVSYQQSFLVGLCQAVSIIPGVSRSAATIIGGLLMGLKRKTIVEFSFLLAVPTMLAASSLDFIKNASTFSKNQFDLLAVGFLVSFVVAVASIKFLLNFIKKHNFIPFGIYRILAAIAFWLIIL